MSFNRKIIFALASLLAFALAFMFVGSLVWVLHGSFEQFPTEEQQEKVRIYFFIAVFLLGAAEAGVLLFLRRQWAFIRKKQEENQP